MRGGPNRSRGGPDGRSKDRPVTRGSPHLHSASNRRRDVADRSIIMGAMNAHATTSPDNNAIWGKPEREVPIGSGGIVQSKTERSRRRPPACPMTDENHGARQEMGECRTSHRTPDRAIGKTKTHRRPSASSAGVPRARQTKRPVKWLFSVLIGKSERARRWHSDWTWRALRTARPSDHAPPGGGIGAG